MGLSVENPFAAGPISLNARINGNEHTWPKDEYNCGLLPLFIKKGKRGSCGRVQETPFPLMQGLMEMRTLGQKTNIIAACCPYLSKKGNGARAEGFKQSYTPQPFLSTIS